MMYTLDFVNPYLIYLLTIGLTLLTIAFVLLKRHFSTGQKVMLYTVFSLLLLYSISARYIIPYVLEGAVRFPFFPTRLAAILSLIYLIVRPKGMRFLVYFIASTNIVPVFFPMGHPRNIMLLDEIFLIDHYVGAVIPFLLIRFEDYTPSFKDAVISAFLMAVVIFTFIPLNEAFGLGSYFFMHERNVILTYFDWMGHYHFAGLLTISLFVFYLLYVKMGQRLAKKVSSSSR